MDLVKLYPHSLDKEFCERLIRIYERLPKKDGVVSGGYRPEVKLTKDGHSDQEPYRNDPEWRMCEGVIRKELSAKLERYIYDINKGEIKPNNFFPNGVPMEDAGFQIQRYTANEGEFKFHQDFSIKDNGKYRILTYLWYLNDVADGGETQFYDGSLVVPETGKLLLFPALWTYPHRGVMPLSNDKYIMTGWIYSHI